MQRVYCAGTLFYCSMSNPFLNTSFPSELRRAAIALAFVLLGMVHLPSAAARDSKEAPAAAMLLTKPLEEDGYQFRAEAWVKDLSPDVGKAVRLQLFKGNDYRFCVAVPPNSGVKIAATVLDLQGKPAGTIQRVEDGWGLILGFKPPATGVYVVAIRQTPEGRSREVSCALITGYK